MDQMTSLNLFLIDKKYRIAFLCITAMLLNSFVYSQQIEESAPASDNHQVSIDSLTEQLSAYYKRGHIKGFGVAIVTGDTILYETGFGYANESEKIPYTSRSLQNIASISKTFLGLAILKAQEQGKLKLENPINKYLPFKVQNPYYPNIEITIRQLTTHTSSITDSKYYDKNPMS